MSEQEQIQIKTEDEEMKGVYSNMMQTTHTKEEFILDFFLISSPQGILVSRIIMSPGHFKRMIKTLKENIKKYEKSVGKIKETEKTKEKVEKNQKIGFDSISSQKEEKSEKKH